MSRSDSNFTHHSQNIPTAPLNHHAAAPFIERAPVWAALPSKRHRRGWLVAVLILMMLVVIGAGLGAFFWATRPGSHAVAPSKRAIVGHAFFTSSGNFDAVYRAPSFDDELQIDLRPSAAPSPGKSYYGWLLRDANQLSSTQIALGPLTLTHGALHLTYRDPQHANLLGLFSHILITEGDSAQPPEGPSGDPGTWKYSAELPQTPNPNDPHHLSMLNHLRLLLVQDPILAKANRPGGSTIWFLQSTGRVAEWAYSARGFWSPTTPTGMQSMRDQFIRILDYLDGDTVVQADVPPGTLEQAPTLIGLLGTNTPDAQTSLAAGYLNLISAHLSAIAHDPGVPVEKRQLATMIITSINTVRSHLEVVRQDAKQLLSMKDAQLLSPSSNALKLLNDMMAQAFYAYAGQPDPSIADLQSGAVQIQYGIDQLATFDITQYKP
jgi:hypothetical protein